MAAAATAIQRRYIDGPFGQIHVAESGAGPAALLIHQTPRSWDEYREVLVALSHQNRLVAMDLPGMGASCAPRAAASIQDYALAAAAVVRSLGGEPVAVCGHHTGGVVAIELAAAYPHLVRSLVLSSTPWVDAEARKARAVKAPMDAAGRDPDGEYLARLWRMRQPYYPRSHTHLERFMADALKARDPAEGHRAVGGYPMERRAPGVGCPVLIVEHAKDPFAARHTKEMARAFPDAPQRRIENGRVALDLSAQEFAAAVGDWLLDASSPGDGSGRHRRERNNAKVSPV